MFDLPLEEFNRNAAFNKGFYSTEAEKLKTRALLEIFLQTRDEKTLNNLQKRLTDANDNAFTVSLLIMALQAPGMEQTDGGTSPQPR